MWDRTTMGKSYFFLSLLQAAVSMEWTINVPSEVTAQRGLCARIPCHYRYPARLNKIPPVGIWINGENGNYQSIAFHSGDHSKESPSFYRRTRLSGDLRDGNCPLVIDSITQEDEGPYYFRTEFNYKDSFSFFPATRLRVSDFTDKPSIFPVETVEGKTVNVTCTFNTTCDGTASTLTWVTPIDEPLSVSHSVTQWGDKLTYTSVVSLTPALKHHRQNLTCRFRYRTVSSEQTLTLTVQYSPQNLSITSSDKVNKSWVSIKEGNSTAILCSVQSFPASNLTWRHLGVTLNKTSSNNELWLEFPQVTPHLTGVYQCVAENKHGTAERTVTLAIELPATDGQRLPVIPLAAAAGVVFLIILSTVICCILKSRWRTDRPQVDASRTVTREESGTVQMRERQMQEERYEMHHTQSETAQDKGQMDTKTTMNMNQLQEDIYANCLVEDPIYANV
ncbi:sialic acid-binding Ig-like lectin 13 [Leucoraja erinacea]|uniref:sialic acid-binding Ig-like lectin 13 n=1 Tax=Leucoraja erinaceus TaxID=7782 RepID=UPI00245794E2|nr:sialic acid-binding Ig-like lectin 13 [Leucoraja erinacea]